MIKNIKINLVTIFCLAVSYYGIYYIGYHQGKITVTKEFIEYVKETSKTLEDATTAVKEATDLLDQLENYYECRPKNETIPSQSNSRSKVRG